MKKIKIVLSLITFITMSLLPSCGKGGDQSPVDQIVAQLNEAAEKTKEINNMADLTNVRNIISPEDVLIVIQENSDYKLTKGDKEKLKKSYNKLVDAAYDKSCEFVSSEELKKTVKNQLELMMEGIDINIDNAETLGQIRGFN